MAHGGDPRLPCVVYAVPSRIGLCAGAKNPAFSLLSVTTEEGCSMPDKLEAMTLESIMTRWPVTLRVFVDWRLHCVGCPIADFHRLADSAQEHGYELEALKQAIQFAIATGGAISAGPPPRRRRSTADDAAP
jgi:hybrid cluster-associated redox disulfide protein